MKRIYLVDLEPIETRYTSEWKTFIPRRIRQEIRKRNSDVELVVIEGSEDLPECTSPGAFLNFGGTNIYKSQQLIQIAELFNEGKINAGDKFLYTDSWNPTILQVKYMSELMNIPVEIHAMWHAGSYDKNDFLGRTKDKKLFQSIERSLYEAIDYNYFATNYHEDLFPYKDKWNNRIVGWPMEYLEDKLLYRTEKKKDIILFPHRISEEKQLHIFKELEVILPQYTFIVCQEKSLTKYEYHKLLGESKLVFSANLQETLGISMYEGLLAGALPLVPDRLSYWEMYTDLFKYDNTDSVYDIAERIKYMMTNYDLLKSMYLESEIKKVSPFFNSERLINYILQ